MQASKVYWIVVLMISSSSDAGVRVIEATASIGGDNATLFESQRVNSTAELPVDGGDGGKILSTDFYPISRGSGHLTAISKHDYIVDGAVAKRDEGMIAVVGTRDGLILRTDSGGLNWSVVRATGVRHSSNGFKAASYVQSLDGFILIDAAGQVLLSDRDANTWVPQVGRVRADAAGIFADKGAQTLVFTASGSVEKYSDLGESGWVTVKPPDADPIRQVCHKKSGDLYFAVTRKGIVWSSGGDASTWSTLDLREFTGVNHLNCDGDMLLAATTSEPEPFEIKGLGGSQGQFGKRMSIDAATGDVSIEFVSGGIAASSDQGRNWFPVAKQNFPFTYLFDDESRVVAFGVGGYFSSERNSGRSWRKIYGYEDEQTLDIVAASRYGGSSEITALTRDGLLFDSMDGARSWSRVSGVEGGRGLLLLKNALLVYGDGFYSIARNRVAAPAVVGMTVQSKIASQVIIDFRLADDSGVCGLECVEVFGLSEADYESGLGVIPRRISKDFISSPAPNVVRVGMDPAKILSSAAGEDFRVFVRLVGEGYSLRFPAGDDWYVVSYLPEYRLIYFLGAFVVLAIGVVVYYLFPLWLVYLEGRLHTAVSMLPLWIAKILELLLMMIGARLLINNRSMGEWTNVHKPFFTRRLSLIADSIGGGSVENSSFSVNSGERSELTNSDLCKILDVNTGSLCVRSENYELARLFALRLAYAFNSDAPAHLSIWVDAHYADPDSIGLEVERIAGRGTAPDGLVEGLLRTRRLIIFLENYASLGNEKKDSWNVFIDSTRYFVVLCVSSIPLIDCKVVDVA